MVHIKDSVPQGSILGPILFIIYVNHLSYCTHEATSLTCTIQYADDTKIYATNKTQSTLQDWDIEGDNTLSSWFTVNRLCLNTTKTAKINFTPQEAKNDNTV